MTVAIATFNAGEYLLPSIRSVLDQTYVDLEVIVVDDGSTDGSVDDIEAIADTRLTIIRQENKGKSVALNRIRDESEGKYFAIHDGDDISNPDRIRRQVDVMEAQPEIGACFTRHDLLLGEVRFAPRRLAANATDVAACIEAMTIPAIDPTGFYRLSMMGDLEFEPALRIGQGVDYILRLGERHPMVVIGDSLYSYRISSDSTTRRAPLDTHRYIEIVRQRAAERRDIEFVPTSAPSGRGQARHAYFGHILEATVESVLAGDRLESARIAWTTVRRAGLGLDGLKPAVVTVLPKSSIRRMRPTIDPDDLVRGSQPVGRRDFSQNQAPTPGNTTPPAAAISHTIKNLVPDRMQPLGKKARQTQVGLSRYLIYIVGHVPSHRIRNTIYRRFFGISLGRESTIHFRARFYHPRGITIGHRTSIGNDVMLDGRWRIDIGDMVNFGGEVAIFTAEHDPQSPTFETVGAPVKIRNHVYVGTRVMIMPGVTVGEGAVLASGAVVTKDVEEYKIVGGVPAQVIGERSRNLRDFDTGFKMPFQ